MYNDDIFSILMAAEESMVKADLGVEDSYEAYAIESALESACYEDDSYGWDTAMEADEGSDAPKSFGDKIKAAGKWILDAIKGLFKKAGDLWHKIVDWIMSIFKKKKSAGNNVSNDRAQRTEKSEDVAPVNTTKPSTPKSVVNNRAIEMKKEPQPEPKQESSNETLNDQPKYVKPQESRFQINNLPNTDKNQNKTGGKTTSEVDKEADYAIDTSKYKKYAKSIIELQEEAITWLLMLKNNAGTAFQAYSDAASNIDPHLNKKNEDLSDLESVRLSGDYNDRCKELVDMIKARSEKIKDIKREAISGTEEHSQGRMNEINILNAFIRDAYNNNIGLLTPRSIRVIREQELFCKKIVAACESDKPEWEDIY